MNIHELLGRRYSFPGGEAMDITIVSVDPQARRVRVHAEDRTKANLSLDDILEAIERGAIEESTGAPFVFDDVQNHVSVFGHTIRRHGRMFFVPNGARS